MDNEIKYPVSYRGGFADRNGIIPVNTIMQVESFDNRTRTAILNEVAKVLHITIGDLYDISGDGDMFWRAVFQNVYSLPIQYNTSYRFSVGFEILKSTIMKDNYASILSLLEFIIRYFSRKTPHNTNHIIAVFNNLFEKECVGYRYIKSGFVPITETTEKMAVEVATQNPYSKVRGHLENAIRLFSDRDYPDYSNTIKESISAVEAMCSIILGKNDSLNSALIELEKRGVQIHSQLKTAFINLFNYTSDASGIRHAGKLDGHAATFEEAKFMLVTCCAFVNYLLGVLARKKDN